MKTVICRRCKTEFNPRYEICPSCGAIWKSRKVNLLSGKACYICAWIAIGLVLLSVVFYGVNFREGTSITPESSQEQAQPKTDIGELAHIDGEYRVIGARYSHDIPYGGVIDMNDAGDVVISMGEKSLTSMKYHDISQFREEIDGRYEIEYVYSESLPENMIWDVLQEEKKLVVVTDVSDEEMQRLEIIAIQEQLNQDGVENKYDPETERFDINIAPYDASQYIGQSLEQVCTQLETDIGLISSQIKLVPYVGLKASPGVVTAVYPYEYNSLMHITENTMVILYYYPAAQEEIADACTGE